MAKILERLELDRPLLITSRELDAMLQEEGIATPVAVFAARMREKGWLLPTGQRSVWEFAPASYAGAYSTGDKFLPLQAFMAAHDNLRPMLTGHSAAWAFFLANRMPVHVDVVLPHPPARIAVPEGIRIHAYEPRLAPIEVKGVLSLALESVVVHMAARPSQVYSWQSASEWLPEIAYDITSERVIEELAGRPQSVVARTGYLLQGMRPDIAKSVHDLLRRPSKVRFGPRKKSRRNDEHWGVSDTLLPFDPREMEDVRWEQ